MLPVQDLRNGTTFEMEGVPWVCLSYEHIKLGRGTATIKIKARNLLSGATLDKAFINSARVQDIALDKKEAQYLYEDEENHVFMDKTSFEQYSIPKAILGDQAKFLKDGLEVKLLFWSDRALSIELPLKMEFKVAQADPGFRGNSVTNLYKDAVLENGTKVKVPLFVNEGEVIRVDTRTGEYVERVGK